MKKIINNIKKYRPPKLVIYFLLFLIVFSIFCAEKWFDNDTWFLLKHGEYVLNNGFPHVEPFSMHSDLSFVMQQWLSSVIFYLVFSLFKKSGLGILVMLIFAITIILIQKIGLLMSNNKFYLTSMITFVISILLFLFMVARPHIFTFLIILLLIYNLELYIKNKKVKNLYILILLSFLQINLHASMWPMLFIFILPYLIEFFIHKEYLNKHIFIVLLLMFLVGFINPYGIDGITYLFGSYNVEEINNYIGEMQPIRLSDFTGKIIYFSMFITYSCYLLFKKNRIKWRFFFLLIGTTYLSLSHYKGYSWFLVGAILPLNNFLSDYFSFYSKKKYSNRFKFIVSFECLIVIVILFIFFNNNSNKKLVDYNLEKSVNYLKTNYNKNINLYTDYNNGSYCLYNNYRVYIDTRAEVYLKSKNKKEDIYIEYYNLQGKKQDILEFLNKYKFDVLLVEKNDVLYDYLKENNAYYRKVYGNDKYNIYEILEIDAKYKIDK